MILRSPLSLPPDPLAGPRRIGDQTDYIQIDPDNKRITPAGSAGPLEIPDLQYDLGWLPQSGEYTTGLFNGVLTTGGGLGADYLYAVPCILPRQGTFEAMGLHLVVQDSGKNVRLGVYAESGGNPGALIADAGEFSTSTSGIKEVTFTFSQVLGPGRIWLAIVTNSNVATFLRTDQSSAYVIANFVSGGNIKALRYVWRDFTYGSLPDPFGTANRDDDSSLPPHLMLKVA